MSVPVRGTIRPRTRSITVYDKDGKPITLQIGEFTENLAAEVGERLIALEKAVRGGALEQILSPEATPFGPGASTNVTNVTTNVTNEGETDHGALTGLGDDDHPQYVQHHEATPPLPHQHQTGPAVDLTDQATAEGVSTLLARADHTHLKLIGAEDEGVDLGSVSAVNLIGPGLDVQIEPNLTGSLLTGLYGYWPFDEESGTRRCAIGTAPDLTETGGSVPSAAGKFGNAISGTEADTFELGATGASIPMSGGLTLEFWFYWPASPSIFPDSMLTIGPVASNTYINIFRFYDSNFLAIGYRWSAAAGDSVSLPLPRPGPFAVDTWHLLIVTYDAATGILMGRVDDGCVRERTPNASIYNPAWRLSATVPPASLAAANAVTLTTLSFMKAFNVNYKNFEGRIDAPAIWTRCLTDDEVARLWVNFRATVSVNPHYRTAPLPHPHLMADVADLRPDDAQFILAQQRYGG